MKIRNITGGILQDTKTGWTLKPGEVLELEDRPEFVERAQQLAKHKLIEILEGAPQEPTVTVREVEATDTVKEAEATEQNGQDQQKERRQKKK